MSLKKSLMEDLKTSMKNKDTLRKNTITMVRAGIKQKEVDERRELDDEDIMDIIAKQLKEKRNAIKEFDRGGRQDLVEQTEKEMEILLKYLPEQLTEEEVEEIVKAVIEEVDAKSMKDMGIIMKNVMPKIKGRADGSVVNKVAKKYLK
ncbi:GatB/YqeY domain-containing protein [Anaerosalibacter bizertensis]|uniref:GatB/YqeY domain-containing protein n=1 Tax=Anaerosalibacter bizertensis TaxID=932217 RepID=UPI001C0F1EF9|nr:GatB/YqeY domain-containing protein [Anaerosalibacter bizertensis]MBU5294012.1 GatB/YqeY domain-containing protein [Anaerosalibacter bizertensis]